MCIMPCTVNMLKDKHTWRYCIIIFLIVCAATTFHSMRFVTQISEKDSKSRFPDETREDVMRCNSTSKEVNPSSADIMHRNRLKRLHFRCFEQRNLVHVKGSSFNVNLHFARNINLGVCKIPKIGSTFLMQMLLKLVNPNSQKELFGKSRVSMHVMSQKLMESYTKLKEDDTLFLITRDPYTRLYSAFMDKMYLPAMATHSSRIAVKNKKVKGKETTFEEFLQDISDVALSGHDLDPHWKPIYNTCQPCVIPYDVIAKQESYSQDIEYILSKLNISEEIRNFLAASLHSHHKNNSIKEITKVMFGHAARPSNKIAFGHSFLEFCERLWHTYCVQGYIRSTIKFPHGQFSKLYFYSVNEAVDIFLYYTAVSNMTRSESMQQRNHFLTSAYRNVSNMTISKIKEVYALDFILFDYSINPPV